MIELRSKYIKYILLVKRKQNYKKHVKKAKKFYMKMKNNNRAKKEIFLVRGL